MKAPKRPITNEDDPNVCNNCGRLLTSSEYRATNGKYCRYHKHTGGTIYYDHARRQCFNESGNQSIPITIEEAREAWESCCLADYNLAFGTLANHDWDMERVEEYYQERDPPLREKVAKRRALRDGK
jgi:hypothetical protein